jgi:2-iminobutanoate/2-iminopropanoate deaminase
MPRQSCSLCKKLLLLAMPILAGASVQAADNAAASKPQFLNSPQAEQRGLPFSEAVRAGDFLFLAGQVGDDRATGKLVPGGIVPEARQTLQHIKEVLERNGSSLADVVKCTVFLADIGEWSTFNTVYREFFKKPFPARSALGASGLAQGARVEVECIAYAPQG